MGNYGTQMADAPARREVDYRLSKWILTNIEQLLEPEEIKTIWTELLSFYSPWSASVENVCGTITGDPLVGYIPPEDTIASVETAGDQNG